MIRKEKNGIFWLEFELLQPFQELKHGVFLRHGGVGEGKFESLNLSYDMGDDGEAVDENLRRVSFALGESKIVWGKQVHGKGVGVVDHTTGANEMECDAMVSEEPGVSLMVKHADCQPGLLYDPKKRVIGAVHSGWRSSVQNIFGATVEVMSQKFGCRPEDLLVCIGPSLGPEHAEFINYREVLPKSFWKYEVTPNHFNLWEVSRQQLLDSGILPEHIEIAKIDTYANEKDFFSHRRGKDPGRHGTLIGLSNS